VAVVAADDACAGATAGEGRGRSDIVATGKLSVVAEEGIGVRKN